VLDALQLPFFQRGLAEVLLLAVGAGLLGTWIVLRGLAFFTHAVGTATFPGLVLADGLGFAPVLGALGAAVLVAAGVGLLGRRRPDAHGAATALVLCGALALGVILASDVFGTQAGVDTLLFGSLLTVGTIDLALAAAASVAAVATTLVLGPRWLAVGFDPPTARSQGVRSQGPDTVLLAAVALSAVGVLAAVGALLATALLVVPAATMRLVTSRLRAWQLWSIGLAAAEGVAGLWLSYVTDAPPGATIAVLGGAVFALVAWAQGAGARTRAALAVAAVAGLAAAGFATGPATDDGRPQVVATTTQLGDVTRAIAGDAAHVTQLLQPAADPHEYEPRPSDVRAVSHADLILASGRHLDDWIGDVAGDAGAGSEVVRVGDAVPDRVRTDEGLDPHWWHDARNMAAAARVIGERLAPEVGADGPAVRRRAAAYARRAERLDAAIARCIAQVPRDGRKLVTDHDAFATFAARYGLQVVGAVISSRTTQAQASAGDVARLTRLIRREHVRAVFPERAVDPRLARALARQAGARVGGRLYADALGPRGSPGATWAGSEAANADTIVAGLTSGRRRCRIAGP